MYIFRPCVLVLLIREGCHIRLAFRSVLQSTHAHSVVYIDTIYRITVLLVFHYTISITSCVISWTLQWRCERDVPRIKLSCMYAIKHRDIGSFHYKLFWSLAIYSLKHGESH